MNYFLVDYENVRVQGLQGIAKLNADDVVVVFYSIHADTLTFDLHKQIVRSPATIEFQKVLVGGKNALDFQLCSYLGFLIRNTMDSDATKQHHYHIVSKDNGYHILSDYWKERGIEVATVGSIAETLAHLADSAPPQENNISDTEKLLRDILPDESCAPDVLKIINHYKTKQGVNNGLVKKFASQKAGEIYRAIKPLIADKKGR